MFLGVSRNVKILSIGFFSIFFGFSAAQQYVVPFFSDQGSVNVGFYSLILIYLFFMLSGPASSVFVSKYGSKKCMLLGVLTYFVFIAALPLKSHAAVYLASSLLGIGASFLWTGQNTYVVKASDEKYYGANSGFFSSIMMLGSGIGILALSHLSSKYNYGKSFFLLSIFPIIGFLILLKLKDIKSENTNNRFRLIKKIISSKTALRLSSLWFAVNFASGLVIGIIPMQIKDIFGLAYIGMLSSLFFFIPILLSFFFGKLYDRVGRNKTILASYMLQLAALLALYFDSKITLITGIILFSLNRALITPVTYALVGDVSKKENLEFLAAFFWTVQNIGVVLSLIISQILVHKIGLIYFVSIFVTVVSLFILQPIFKLNKNKIRKMISKETA